MASRIKRNIGKSHGQRVPPLIKVIINTLRNYPDGSQILKELIQNADDACATEVEFLLDEAHHGTEHLIDPDVGKYQGPALYAWNNALFEEEDWEGIRDISVSRKEKKVLKVGRFALGFISVYHITDFPCILSNNDVLLLDPHMVIDPTGGLIIGLEEFIDNHQVRNHFDTFFNYFGYRGTNHYDGTIFRFPLRTGLHETLLPNTVYNTQKVLSDLFGPFKQEIENCLLFMKNVRTIRVSVKESTGIKLLYSVEVDGSFTDSLNLHRKEMFEFVENDYYLESSSVFISLFLTSLFDCNQNKTERLWLVMNILGLTDQNRESLVSYLPWFAIALPLPHTQHTLDALKHQNCWSQGFTDADTFFEFIDKRIPITPLSGDWLNFVGNIFCFLPIAATSKFPFHIHGYFALSTNRRSIKWPRYDDLSDEAKWNKELVDNLGAVSYAIIIYLMISRFVTEGKNGFLYSLWSCLPSHSETDELQQILHSRALGIVKDTKLVWCEFNSTWIKLINGYYLPSLFGRTIPHEDVCHALLLELSQPLVEMTPKIAQVIKNYDFLMQNASKRIISPDLIRNVLIRFKNEQKIINILKNEQNVYALLEVVLSDIDFSSQQVSKTLDGIRLIPVCNSDLPMFFGRDHYFISEGSQDYLELFPGIETNFVKRSLPHHVNSSLLKLSRTGHVNIFDISNIVNKPQMFIDLLKSSMSTFFNLNVKPSIKWTPGSNNHPERTWIEQVWKFVNQNNNLITALKKNQLPLLPRQPLDVNEIDLLRLSTSLMPYLEHSTVPAHQEIENLIASCGCQICHHHPFIIPFYKFVAPPIPRGLFSILKTSAVNTKFLKIISNADDSIRQSLILLVLSAGISNDNDIFLIKSFPVFKSMSNSWISLNPGKTYCLPPNTVPKHFDFYPHAFLNPFHHQNIELCLKVGVTSISLDETVQHHLFPLIYSNTLWNQPNERNQLSLWVLRNHSLFDQNVLSTLSTTKWLLDSSVNYNHSLKKITLFSPTELIDSQDALISKLIPPCIRDCIRGIFPSELYQEHSNTLKLLGLMSSTKLGYHNFQNVIRGALQNIGKVNPGDFEFWVNALVDLISLHMKELKLSNNADFWYLFKKTPFIYPSSRNQCCNYPECLPFFTNSTTLFTPSETILCSDKDSCLVAGVAPLLITKLDSIKNFGEIYKLMGFQTIVPIQLVCQQLTIITKQKNLNHHEIHSFVKKIYKYFARFISNKELIKLIKLPNKFVFIPEFGFFDCQYVVFSCDEILFPYIFSLEKYYPTYEENLYQFFKRFKIESDVGFPKCQFVLQRLPKSILSQSEVNLALKLIQISADSIQNVPAKKNCFILAQDCRIYSSVQCVFNDLPWLERSQILTDKPVVHSEISNSVADRFGCSPASSELTPTAESISYSFMSNAGQKENLVKRLKSILDGYRVHSDVFLELIQNSDDAGAERVKILFDYTYHPSTSVLHRNMEKVHGPALYFFNDSMFTARDFKSILELSSGNKLNDATKIGRFGVGFNAVYNFTDCPSFVSDSSVQIFDPLRKYIGHISQDSGIRLSFTRDETAVLTYRDQFQIYNDIFDCHILNREPYNSTLFRLPFRVIPSKLSSQTFNIEEIARIQMNILQELPQIILFLQNVTSIEVYEKKETKLPPTKLLTVSKTGCSTTRFLHNNKDYFEAYLRGVKDRSRPKYVIKSSDVLSVSSKSQTEEVTQKFLISYASGIQECFDVLQKFDHLDITFLPLCGVAIPLDNIGQTSKPSQYNIYTFLPLPIRSPLLLHINGYFSLSSSRKNLSDLEKPGSGELSDVRTDWNLALINDALSNVLIYSLEIMPRLEPLSCSCQPEHIFNYYSLWPVKESTNFLWKKFHEFFVRRIFDSFPNAKIFSNAHDPSNWVAFDQVSFLNMKEDYYAKSEFIRLIFKLAYQRGIIFANFPPIFRSTVLYKVFKEFNPGRVFELRKICEVVIFPKLNEFSLENLVLVFNNLTPLCTEGSEDWLFDSLRKIAFIPCGNDDGNNIRLRVPSEVVCPNTKITPLYRRSEMRIPIPELHENFDLRKPEVIPIVLKRMGVIYHRLPECEVISRCSITSELDMESSVRHAETLIKYLHHEEESFFQSVYPKIKSIPFIPTYKDKLFEALSIKYTHLASPDRCYAYSSRYLVSPLHLCFSENLRYSLSSHKFSIPPTPSLDVVLLVLETLISNSRRIGGENLGINQRILEIYEFLSDKVKEGSNITIVKDRVRDAPWIWHPDYKQFYKSDQVILSPEFKTLSENKFIISFPFTDSLRDENFKSFFITLGVREKIDDSIIMICLEKIQQEYKETPLELNLVSLVLKLIESIENCHVCSEKIFILNRINILRPPCELYIHLSPHLEQEGSNQLVHSDINYTRALQLGAKTSEELFSKNTDFDESDFGVEEEITDRIQSLVRDLPNNAFINELIQNADDAEATEIVFILDDQDYSSLNQTLSLPEGEYPNWKYLHSFPSLSVYNNKGFGDEDFKGIQTLSVGGKTHNRKSIGKFGVGFNSVYQITDTPTFLTSQPGSDRSTFCCIDPFIKYTMKKSETGESRKKRGKRIDIPTHNINKFDDQLYPFKFTKFRDNPEVSMSLANLWNDGEFTMFRFPLDIESVTNIAQKVPYRKGESRKLCPLKTILDIMTNHISDNSEILLFLNHVQSLKVISIGRYGDLKLEYSQSFRVLEEISKSIPSYFPQTPIADVIKIQKKECVNVRTTYINDITRTTRVYRIYSFPDIPIEQYVAASAELIEHSGKYNEEKLWGFGGIAVCISPFKRITRSNIFTFLPFVKDRYPVHINAPLIFDASRQHYNNDTSSWVEAWHSSIIKCILAPLYAMLILDLRDPFRPVDTIENKIGYFEWFYHLFPVKTKTHQFLVKLSEELYSFLYETNQPVLLCDNLEFSDELKWYPLHGDNCGVFKPIFFPTNRGISQDVSSVSKTYRHEVATPYLPSTRHSDQSTNSVSPEKEKIVRESLILIQFPLSFAPNSLVDCFIEFKLVLLDQSLLLHFLRDNIHTLFHEITYPCNISRSLLNFKQFQTILGYILTANDELFQISPIIPLRIDIGDNVRCFRKDKPSYRHEYSSLIPHHSQSFISSRYDPLILHKLTSLGYVDDLSCDYLVKHLDVEKFEYPRQYLLFWKFVVQFKLSEDDLYKFYDHKFNDHQRFHELIPLTSSESPQIFFPVNYLKFVISETLNEQDQTLYNALHTLGCPSLSFKFFNEHSSTETLAVKIKSYLDRIVISQTRSAEIVLGSLSFSSNLSVDLGPEEAYKLFQIVSQLNLLKCTDQQLRIISELKIFKTHSEQLLALSQCDICFMDAAKLVLGPSILRILQDSYKLVILQTVPEDFLKVLCDKLNKRLIDVNGLLVDYVLRNLCEIPFEEQKKVLKFISQRLAGGTSKSQVLIQNLSEVPFILGKRHYKVKELYSRNIDFVIKFLPDRALPEEWDKRNFRQLFSELGLRDEISLNDILTVAWKFHRRELPPDSLPYLLNYLGSILSSMNFSPNKLDQQSIQVLRQIGGVSFLPAWSIQDIINNITTSQLVRFCDAQLNEFQYCCSTATLIHGLPFEIPENFYQFLNIVQHPNPELIKQHLIIVIDQVMCQHNQLTNIPTIFDDFFTYSYENLEKYSDTSNMSFKEFRDLPCILNRNELYYPINMLFTSSEELAPFVLQLPPSLAGLCPKFLENIGVEKKASYKHFTYIILKIHSELQTLHEELKDSIYLSQVETVFNRLIGDLREQETANTQFSLDLTQILLLTNDSKLVPCADVIFGDNPLLLSRVAKLQLQFNILKPLEPDQNKSCVPPACLQLTRLTQFVKEEIDPNVYNNMVIHIGSDISNSLQDKLKNPFVFRAMRRLYFHLTKKDLEKLLLKNGETCIADNKVHPGFLTVSQLFNNLQILCVRQIDLLIVDSRHNSLTVHPISNSSGAFIDANNTFLISSHTSKQSCIYKDISYALNVYLGNIFTEVLSSFELCFMLDPTELMDKLNEYNIAIDPWPFLQIPAPTRPVPVPIPAPIPIPPVTIPAVTVPTYLAPTYTAPVPTPRPRPRPRGISIGEPDIPAAKLWLMVSQCDLYAASHLVTPSSNKNHLFPAYACFYCFEAVIKAFIALLHYKGSGDRLLFERNLRVYLDLLPFLVTGRPQLHSEINQLTIPLINYDVETRVPSATCTPGMGCYFPQQIFTKKQAEEAIKNASKFIDLIVKEIPEMGEVIITEENPILKCLPSPNPPLITAILTFDVGDAFKKINLAHESEDFCAVSRCFYTSMPYSEIISIQKIYNPTSWNAFKQNIIDEINIHPESCLYIRSLFHGSSGTNPDVIINDPEGFKMELASRGLWGKGIYFATNCSYSHNYTHSTEDGLSCVFLATVFVGYAKELPEDREITIPPMLPNDSMCRYHSVQGRRGGDVIHIVYKNCMAYPSFLITYKYN